ncbi:MAG: hypothetical protein EBR79_04375, partial [Proteobacteria bacterium]|nr:hypothetical protein [Pseudomonadota bacterium]
ASTPAIIRAARKPVADNPHVYTLPPAFRQRFYPLVAQNWYDTFNERTAAERAANHPLHGSVLDGIPLTENIASIGYHPLPAGLEYELSPALFPQLHPSHRFGSCPGHLKTQLALVVSLLKPAAELAKYHMVTTEPLRQLLARMESASPNSAHSATPASQNTNAVTATSAPTWQQSLQTSWLPFLAPSQLLINVKRLFANRTYRQALAAYHPGLPQSLFRFRESALAWRRLRYRLVTKYPAAWCHAVAKGLEMETAETQLGQFTESQHHTAASQLYQPFQRLALAAVLPKVEKRRQK